MPELELNKEYPQSGELWQAEALKELVRKKMARDYAPGKVLRDAHPKQHGCVAAEFVVDDDVPSELADGFFARPGTYRAWVRFSNQSNVVLPDSSKDILGVGVKIVGVEGDKLQNDERLTQDFVMISHPVFTAPNAGVFLGLLRTVVSRFPLLKFFWFVFNPFSGEFAERQRVFKNLQAALRHHANPLATRYWSTTPFLVNGRAVKCSIVPQQIDDEPPPDYKDNPNYLRRAMRQRLDPAAVGEGVAFDFMLQTQRNADTMPIEDPSVPWDESESPFVKVATLRIPRQVFATAEQMAFGDQLAFTPWHGLKEHRPLGGINRVRQSIYNEISKYRHSVNASPLLEPDGHEEFGGPQLPDDYNCYDLPPRKRRWPQVAAVLIFLVFALGFWDVGRQDDDYYEPYYRYYGEEGAAFLADNEEGLRHFISEPLIDRGLPLIVFKILPYVFPEYFGPPTSNFQRLGFHPIADRVLPWGLGRTETPLFPTLEPLSPHLEVVNLTCAACHIGKVTNGIDGPVYLVGAPNNHFTPIDFTNALLRATRSDKWDYEVFKDAIGARPWGYFGMSYLHEIWERTFFYLAGDTVLDEVRSFIPLVARAGQLATQYTYGDQHEGYARDWVNGLAHMRKVERATLLIAHPGRTDAMSIGLASIGYPDSLLPPVKEDEVWQHFLPPRPALVDFPAVWEESAKERPKAQYDGGIHDAHARNIAAIRASMGAFTRHSKEVVVETAEFVAQLPSPKYELVFGPGSIDGERSKRGEAIYRQRCSECHVPNKKDPETAPPLIPAYAYEVVSAPAHSEVWNATTIGSTRVHTRQQVVTAIQTVKFDTIGMGTDPNRALAMNRERYSRLRQVVMDLCSSHGIKSCSDKGFTIIDAGHSGSYLPPSLYGIWVSAPYLHNGSVPSLRAFFKSDDERPATFWRGIARYDTADVGFYSEAPGDLSLNPTAQPYDTTFPGDSNRGHNSPRILGDLLEHPDQVDDLIEYLKTL